MWSEKIIRYTKLQLYRTLKETVILYGAKAWYVSKKQKQKIRIDMDCLRKSCIRNEEIKNNDRTEEKLLWYCYLRWVDDSR